MTTVISILNLALKDIGVVGEGQTVSGESMADAFTTLQQMIGLWQADEIYVGSLKDTPFPATGAMSYSIGIGGDVPIVRPLTIDQMFWRSNGADFPIGIQASFEDYERVNVKNINAWPSIAFYMPTFPLGTLFVFPAPSNGELHIVTVVDLPTYASSYDLLAVSPEYEMAIRYSLAEMLCVTFQTPERPDLSRLASRARRLMKRNNVRVPILDLPGGLLRTRNTNWRAS